MRVCAYVCVPRGGLGLTEGRTGGSCPGGEGGERARKPWSSPNPPECAVSSSFWRETLVRPKGGWREGAER